MLKSLLLSSIVPIQELHPFIQAILKNDIKQINEMISNKVDINMCLPDGNKTPLHVAVEYGRTEVVKILLSHQADVNALTKRQFSPLHVAATKGNIEIISLLIKNKATVDIPCDVGCTPLHQAAANGQKEAVKLLVKLGANKNIKEDKYNLTAAQLASMNGHYSISSFLSTNHQPHSNIDSKAAVDNKVASNSNKSLDKIANQSGNNTGNLKVSDAADQKTFTPGFSAISGNELNSSALPVNAKKKRNKKKS